MQQIRHLQGLCLSVRAKKPYENCLPGNCANSSAASSTASSTANMSTSNGVACVASAPTMANVTTLVAPAAPAISPDLDLGNCGNSGISDLDPDPDPDPDTLYPTLPLFPSENMPTFKWGNSSGTEFVKNLDDAYAEVVHWRCNCFTVPFGKAGRSFVSELSRLYLAFGSSSLLEAVALKAATVFPILLLQKPSWASETKHHTNCLERRLVNWSNGELNELVREGRALQQRLPKHGSFRANNNHARNFANLMFVGKCKAALDLLSKGAWMTSPIPTAQTRPQSGTFWSLSILQVNPPTATASLPLNHRILTLLFSTPLMPMPSALPL